MLFSLLEGAAETGGGSSTLVLILIYGAFFAFMWFILIRPQRKKQKEADRMQNEIKVGDPVLTSGGLYGKVVDIVNDVLMIEFGTNKSVRVPVMKGAIVAVREPELSIAKDDDEE